jgi:hypothetical protein
VDINSNRSARGQQQTVCFFSYSDSTGIPLSIVFVLGNECCIISTTIKGIKPK